VSDTTIVIGGGHNGLTTAAMLAKAGRKVQLIEARDELGGLAGRIAFGDGFAVPGILHDTRGVRPAVVDVLGLGRFGLQRRAKPVAVCAPREEGEALWLDGERVDGVGARDKERFQGLQHFIARLRPALAGMLDKPAPDPTGSILPLLLTGLQVRRLGAVDMIELMRLATMCVADWTRDLFQEERLQAAVALPAVQASWAGPWSAGTALSLLMTEAMGGEEIAGGPAALTEALTKAAEAQGVAITTGTRVRRIVTDGFGVGGVELEDGERIEAGRVVSSVDPKQTFLELVGSEWIDERLATDMRRLRARGTTAKVHLGIEGILELADGKAVNAMRTGETLDDIEKAYDAVKYRQMSKHPVLDVRVWDDEGMCPEGHQSVSILAHFAPYDLEAGWSDETRAQLGDAVVAELERYCPGISERVVERQVLTPLDLEEQFGLTEGHVLHGEHAHDQMLFMRPSVDCAHYATPLDGLFLCGSGCHPGGGITCAPGALAARAILDR
jgi:phytoene dehydrogenase-like protein